MLVYSPDGRWLAVATSSGVRLYDATALKLVWRAETRANLKEIAFSSTGETLSGVDTSFQLYQWQVSDGKQLLAKTPADINELPTAFALSPDGSILVAPYYDDTLHIYLMKDGSLAGKIEEFLSMGEMIYSLAISPDAKRMASISFNGEIRVWSITDRKLRGVLPFNRIDRPVSLVFAPDGKLLVNFDTSAQRKLARVLDLPTQTWGQELQDEVVAVTAGKFILSLSPEGLDQRKWGSNKISQTLPEQAAIQGKIASSPDGTLLAVGTMDGIHIWQRETATLAGTIPGRYANYSSLAVSLDGTKLAVGNMRGIDILSVDGSVIRTLTPEDNSAVFSVLAYASAGEIVAGAADNTVFAWKAESGELLWSAETGYSVNDLAFSADGTLLAGVFSQSGSNFAQSGRGLISVWDANTGGIVQQLEGDQQILFPGYSSLAFSPDGAYIVAGVSGGGIDIWQVDDWTLKKNVSSKSFLSWSPQVAFSPDGGSFASAGQDRQVEIWAMPKAVSIRTLKTGKSTIEALAYSADGKMIAVNTLNDIDLWNAKAGGHLCQLTGSKDTPIAIFFTADQRSIISLAKDGIVRIWGLP